MIPNPPPPPPDSNPESESHTLLPLSTDYTPITNHTTTVAGAGEDAYESKDKIIIEGLDSISDYDTIPPFSWAKLWLFTGPGFLMSIAFLDPGNLEGDLQAGAIAGYSLLWLLMWATCMGLLIQLLSARIGVATGKHLAELCRVEYPKWAGLLLWVMAEVALIGADIQEVIGSAIAIQILSNGVLPLWVGVVITASDCFMFLLLENYGVRNLEAVFAVLISTMGLSFAWMFSDARPNGKQLLIGLLVPKLSSRTIRQAVGVVGCVIMPHNVFLHSALVQSRQIDPNKKGRVQEAINYYTIESSAALFISFMINLFVTTVFAKGFYGTSEADSIGLVNAGNYLEKMYGGGFIPVLYIWGIGLLAAGQSSTITGTYAGQFIMGGFLNLRLEKWLRALITRSCAIVPTMIVALVFNKSEASLDVLNEWLNVLQSIQIPFALIPLLTLVAKDDVMGVFKIGPTLEKIAWSVAALVMVINGYLLLDFFIAEVSGFLFGSLAVTCTAAYVAFILYLINHGDCLPSRWFSNLVNKGYSYIGK
ncbi:metal transporter Nramp2-like [Rutidosis leptorrhynchoides]|uniref:metal transporter Nramp2-like n=1 Tax=Rutidosis leptorrhynchoides TaxID=125765 RepID=UPI003A99B983